MAVRPTIDSTEHDRIAAQVEEFLRKGGVITVVEPAPNLFPEKEDKDGGKRTYPASFTFYPTRSGGMDRS